jgi:hypothetical protein
MAHWYFYCFFWRRNYNVKYKVKVNLLQLFYRARNCLIITFELKWVSFITTSQLKRREVAVRFLIVEICFAATMTSNKKTFRGFSPQSELYRPSDRRFSAKLVPTLADRGCRVVSSTNPHGHQFWFSRPEPLFLWNSSSIILTRLSGPRSRPTTSQKIW